jgi:hypothetical protein
MKTMDVNKPYTLFQSKIPTPKGGILFARANSKLCFGQPEPVQAAQNNLPFPPKSETVDEAKNKPLNVQGYGKK